MSFKSDIFTELLKQLHTAFDEKNCVKVQKLWVQCMDLCPPYLQLTKLIDIARKIAVSDFSPPSIKKKKLAILAGSTTTHLKEILSFNLRMRGIEIEIYESPFDSIELEILNSGSQLYSWEPDHILLWPEKKNFQGGDAWTKLQNWHCLLSENLPNAQIIQTTLAGKPERSLGQLESRLNWSDTSIINDLNLQIRRSDKVIVLDLDFLSARFGKSLWFDKRLWFHSKHSFSFDALSAVTNDLSKIVCAISGISYKCLVLDLDNTLWGGVIGDDGLDGISLGESALGEAFVGFQTYVRSLKNRGVILAVCSKNEISIAKEPFQKHLHMVLKDEDISFFVANWHDKATNLKHIAESLEIGTDALVFFDDNPAERKLVRDLLPEVYTVEVPEDPALYVESLDSLGLFDVLQISEEDLSKTRQYTDNFARKDLFQKIGNLDEYLKSLEMKASVNFVNETNFERPLQLINKSNQFNLLTNRYTQSELLSLLKLPGMQVTGFRLADKFGDNGLIAVVITQISDGTLHLVDWVMSCRVLSRGMENFTFNHIVQLAREHNCTQIKGGFRPTKKNALVSNLLEDMGMLQVSVSNEEKRYELTLNNFQEKNNFIHKGNI